MNNVVYSPKEYLISYDGEEIRHRATINAINRAAEIGFFAIKDVWRELGLACSSSCNLVSREKEYPPSYIQNVMKEVGICSLKLNSRTSRTRRYYLPCIIESIEEKRGLNVL